MNDDELALQMHLYLKLPTFQHISAYGSCYSVLHGLCKDYFTARIFYWVSVGFSSRTFIGINETMLSDVLSVVEQDQTGGEKA